MMRGGSESTHLNKQTKPAPRTDHDGIIEDTSMRVFIKPSMELQISLSLSSLQSQVLSLYIDGNLSCASDVQAQNCFQGKL